MVAAITARQWRSLCEATHSHERMAHVASILDVDLDDSGNRVLVATGRAVRESSPLRVWMGQGARVP